MNQKTEAVLREIRNMIFNLSEEERKDLNKYITLHLLEANTEPSNELKIGDIVYGMIPLHATSSFGRRIDDSDRLEVVCGRFVEYTSYGRCKLDNAVYVFDPTHCLLHQHIAYCDMIYNREQILLKVNEANERCVNYYPEHTLRNLEENDSEEYVIKLIKGERI